MEKPESHKYFLDPTTEKARLIRTYFGIYQYV